MSGVILTTLGLIVAGLLFQAIATARANHKFPPPGKLIDVGGHRLHLNCLGEGRPTVVLAAGAVGTSLDWSWIQSELANKTRVCSVDRAGLGWSDPGPEPRTSGRIADELHALLVEAGEEGPFVLVGHSFGGLEVRILAARHPDEVAGLALIDTTHEDFYSRLPPGVRESNRRQMKLLSAARILAPLGIPRLAFPPLGPKGLPTDIQLAANALGYRSTAYRTVYNEALNFEKSAAEARAAGPLREGISMAVLARGKPEAWPAGIPAEEAERTWRSMQEELAGMSATCEFLVVEESGHFIQIERPATVLEAVRRLIEKVRASGM